MKWISLLKRAYVWAIAPILISYQVMATPLPSSPPLAQLDTRFSQGTDIHVETLTSTQISSVNKLISVWGFAKYYHNRVAAGEVNMDAEFFQILPKLLSAKNEKQANDTLAGWLTQLGLPETCRQGCTAANETAYLAADLSWINTDHLGHTLFEALQKLYQARQFKKHYYIEIQPPGIAKPVNELTYKGLPIYADDGLKLLSLARYWNMIQYFSPYRDIDELNWSEIPSKFIPLMIKADSEIEYGTVLFQLMAATKDSHAFVAHPVYFDVFGSHSAPLTVRSIQGKWVITSVLDETINDIKPGDILTSIDDRPISENVAKISPLIPASNNSRKRYGIAEHLLYTNNKKIKLTLDSGVIKELVTVPLRQFQQIQHQKMTGSSHQLIEPGIALLDLASLTRDEVDEVMTKYSETEAIIIDVRNYPRGTYAPLITHLYPSPLQFASFIEPKLQTPGEFTLHEKPVLRGNKNPDFYKGKVILLADASSQSHAEYTLMALRRAPNAIVVGSQTSGADGNTFSLSLPGGYMANITGLGILTPQSHSHTQGIGIVPDLEVTQSIEAVRAGRDRVLEAAIKLAKSEQFAELTPSKTQL